jgi:hypothetical protein
MILQPHPASTLSRGQISIISVILCLLGTKATTDSTLWRREHQTITSLPVSGDVLSSPYVNLKPIHGIVTESGTSPTPLFIAIFRVPREGMLFPTFGVQPVFIIAIWKYASNTIEKLDRHGFSHLLRQFEGTIAISQWEVYLLLLRSSMQYRALW